MGTSEGARKSHTPESDAKRREAMRLKWQDPEYRAAWSAARRGTGPKKKDQLAEEATRRSEKGKWLPEKREAFTERFRERAQQPDFSKIRSKAALQSWQQPGRKEKAGTSQRQRYTDPEAKARHSAAMARPETRAKIAESTRQYWATLTTEQRQEKARKMRRPLKGGQLLTGIEAEVLIALNQLEIPYFVHKNAGPFCVDIMVPSFNLIIECDGFWYHSKPEEKHRDAERDKQLTISGYNVLRLSEAEIKDGSFTSKLPRKGVRPLIFSRPAGVPSKR